MRKGHEIVTKAWKEGRKRKIGPLSTDGQSLYSYGLRIGITVNGKKKLLMCVRPYTVSHTTSNHVYAAKAVADAYLAPVTTNGRYDFPESAWEKDLDQHNGTTGGTDELPDDLQQSPYAAYFRAVAGGADRELLDEQCAESTERPLETETASGVVPDRLREAGKVGDHEAA